MISPDLFGGPIQNHNAYNAHWCAWRQCSLAFGLGMLTLPAGLVRLALPSGLACKPFLRVWLCVFCPVAVVSAIYPPFFLLSFYRCTLAPACSQPHHRPFHPLLGPEVGRTQWSWLLAGFRSSGCPFLESKEGYAVGTISPNIFAIYQGTPPSPNFVASLGGE